MMVKAPDLCSHNIMNDMKNAFLKGYDVWVCHVYFPFSKIQLTIHLSFCVIFHTDD